MIYIISSSLLHQYHWVQILAVELPIKRIWTPICIWSVRWVCLTTPILSGTFWCRSRGITNQTNRRYYLKLTSNSHNFSHATKCHVHCTSPTCDHRLSRAITTIHIVCGQIMSHTTSSKTGVCVNSQSTLLIWSSPAEEGMCTNLRFVLVLVQVLNNNTSSVIL